LRNAFVSENVCEMIYYMYIVIYVNKYLNELNIILMLTFY